MLVLGEPALQFRQLQFWVKTRSHPRLLGGILALDRLEGKANGGQLKSPAVMAAYLLTYLLNYLLT